MSGSKFNRGFIGKTYRSAPHKITSERIREFALATNESNERYTHSDASQNVAPPFLPVVVWPELLQQLFTDPDEIGADRFRVVHAQQEMRWSGFVQPDDIIHSIAEIANIVPRGRHESLDMIVRLMRDNTELAEMTFRLLVLAEGGTNTKKTLPPKPKEVPGRLIAEGKSVVSKDQGRRYAAASGDMNPLHTNDEVGRQLGFPGAILHGLCTLSISTQTIVDKVLEGDPTPLRYLCARFSNPVFMGQILTTRVYTDTTTDEELDSVQFLTVDSEDRPVVADGIARFEV